MPDPRPPHISVLLYLLRVHMWLVAVVLGGSGLQGPAGTPTLPRDPGPLLHLSGGRFPSGEPFTAWWWRGARRSPGPWWWLLRGRHPSRASLCNPPPPDCSAASTHPRASPPDPGRGSPSSPGSSRDPAAPVPPLWRAGWGRRGGACRAGPDGDLPSQAAVPLLDLPSLHPFCRCGNRGPFAQIRGGRVELSHSLSCPSSTFS